MPRFVDLCAFVRMQTTEKCEQCGSTGPFDGKPLVSEQPRVSLWLAIYMTDIKKKDLLKMCRYCLKSPGNCCDGYTNCWAHFEKEQSSKKR